MQWITVTLGGKVIDQRNVYFERMLYGEPSPWIHYPTHYEPPPPPPKYYKPLARFLVQSLKRQKNIKEMRKDVFAILKNEWRVEQPELIKKHGYLEVYRCIDFDDPISFVEITFDFRREWVHYLDEGGWRVWFDIEFRNEEYSLEEMDNYNHPFPDYPSILE